MTEPQNPRSPDDAASTRNATHPAGVIRILVLLLALTIAATVPYTLPEQGVPWLGLDARDVSRLMPWREGSPIPFAQLLDFRPPVRPRIAGVAERQRGTEATDEQLFEAAQLPAAEPVTPAAPVDETSDDAALRVPPEEYAGMTRRIDDPSGSMAHVYDRLADVARTRTRAHAGSEEPPIARILVYSDSINGSDRMTSELRALMQPRFGDGGKGFVPIRPGWQYQRHQDVAWDQRGSFRVRVVNRGEEPSGRYGLGGVLAVNQTAVASATFGTASSGTVGTAVSRYELFYQAFPGGGAVEMQVDERPPVHVSLAAGDPEDRFREVRVPDGPHELEVRVADGEARLYGIVMERDGPGVVVDGLMLVGAFTRVLLNFDAAHWADQIRHRDADLVVFWLGGNDSVSSSVPFVPDEYVEDYPQVMRRAMAGRPDASCLVMSVLDSAEDVDGTVRSRARVARVVEAQREAARRAGCAFFDTYAATGGEGTMRRWFHSSPRLVSVDYRHLVPEGARVVATLFYEALLRGYDERLVEVAERR